MTTIQFQDQSFRLFEGETVLAALARQGVTIPSSCCSGICQSCLMRATDGTTPPAQAQNGLKDTLKAQGYFLACQCTPNTDMQIALPGEDAVQKIAATVVEKTLLNHDIARFRLQPNAKFSYRPGQFVHVHRPDGLIRSYSLASVNDANAPLEIHVRRLPNGQMSNWLHENVQVGDALQISGPSGNCFYMSDKKEQSLLMLGTGCGLAPLIGIAHDALRQGHTGPIHLYHGSYAPSGLYNGEELRALAAQYANFTYTPCVDSDALPGMETGRVDQLALTAHPKLKGWSLYLCGHPDMVASVRKRAFLAGASMRDIYADPFVVSKPAVSSVSSSLSPNVCT